MIAFLNLLVMAFLLGLYFLAQAIGLEFVWGYITAAVLFQIAYRCKHGVWFD